MKDTNYKADSLTLFAAVAMGIGVMIGVGIDNMSGGLVRS